MQSETARSCLAPRPAMTRWGGPSAGPVDRIGMSAQTPSCLPGSAAPTGGRGPAGGGLPMRRRVAASFLALLLASCGGAGPFSTTGPGASSPATTVGTPAPTTATTAPAEPTGGQGYYVSPAGDDANPGTMDAPWRTIQHAADLLEAGETVYLRAGAYTERVQVRRSGTSDAYISFVAYPGESPVIDGAGVVLPADQAGLFEINGADYIRVSGLHIINAGPDDNSNGILVHQARGITLEGNRTDGTRSSGIGVWNSRDVLVRGNEIVRACAGGYQESLTVAGTINFEVADNLVRDTLGGKEGIDAKDGSQNGTIHGNLVDGVPAVGIYIDAWDKLTSDISVYQNTVRNGGGDGIALASEMGGSLENIQIYNNLVYRNGYVGIAITRNGPSPDHPMSGITIVNNTVWSNGTTWGGGITVDNPDAVGVIVRNNVLSENLSFQLSVGADVPPESVTVDHLLIDGYRGNAEDGETRGADYLEGDPQFRDAPAGDFHLQPGSPAVDAGSATDAPAADFDGTPRPQGGGWDIGAYER